VQQEIAKVYGLKASDLVAAASLTKNSTLDKIYNNYMGKS
jgi:hypothetical protein